MIALRANDTWLDLDPKTGISFSFASPLFDRDRLERAYSFPFTLPATPANLQALRYANRLDASAPTQHPAEVHIAGQFFDAGSLSITGASGQQIRAVFQSASINLADTLHAIRLRQLYIPVEIASEYCPGILLIAGWLDPGIERMALRINEHLFDYALDELDDMIAAINAIFGAIAQEPDIGQSPTENVIFISCPGAAQFDIYVNLEEEVADPGVYVFFDVVSSTYTSEATRINTAFASLVAAGGNSEMAFPVVKMPNLYDEKNPGYSGYANYTNPTPAHPNDPTLLDVVANGFPHTLIPLPYVSALLPAIAQAAGVAALALAARRIAVRGAGQLGHAVLDAAARRAAPWQLVGALDARAHRAAVVRVHGAAA